MQDYTQKRLEELKGWLENIIEHDVERKYIKSFLAESIHQAVAEERARVVKSVNNTLDRYVIKKEPCCEQNSLILLIRAYLLASIKEPLTDKKNG